MKDKKLEHAKNQILQQTQQFLSTANSSLKELKTIASKEETKELDLDDYFM